MYIPTGIRPVVYKNNKNKNRIAEIFLQSLKKRNKLLIIFEIVKMYKKKKNSIFTKY